MKTSYFVSWLRSSQNDQLGLELVAAISKHKLEVSMAADETTLIPPV